MSLRAAARWRRSNLRLSRRLLRAKSTPALAGGAKENALAMTWYLIHDTLVLLLLTEQFTPFRKENLLGHKAFA